MDGGDERLPGAPVRRSSRPNPTPEPEQRYKATKVAPATAKDGKLL
jgi:hypothetical protein